MGEEVTYKLTLDVDLTQPEVKVEGMDQLKKWQSEAKIELYEANVNKDKKPEGTPAPVERKMYGRDPRRPSAKKDQSGKADFRSVAAIIFPSRDPLKLNINEINNVAHVIKHHANKYEIFVTANEKVFIENGRREKLKGAFGILTMTPVEAVRMLGQMQGWKHKF